MPAASIELDRGAVLERFNRMRARTRALFDLLEPAAYYLRPVPLRNPVVFYEGHLPAFAVNTLLKRALGEPGIDAHLETIFARGIDPADEADAVARGNPAWPSRDVVRAFAAEADRRLARAMGSADLERPGHPLLDGAEALWTILEHEEMHQETLAYIWHEVPYALKRKPDTYLTRPPRLSGGGARSRRGEQAHIPTGQVTLGTDAREFGWDNERPLHIVDVPAFRIDVHDVTNGDYLEFLNATGANPPHYWLRQDGAWLLRAMFEAVPLPLDWPVYVTWDQAQAYAEWRGMRLPSEAEYHRAAYGTPEGVERRHPWGDEMPRRVPGNFDFVRWDPEPVGAHPEGASAFGVHDLVGNGWEWTADAFAPFDGFRPMASYPEYSADFFDGEHYLIKGASPMTARALTRRGFRNWFRHNYPFVYATFRCVTSA